MDGSDLSIAIIASRYNARFVNCLLEDVLGTFKASGVDEEDLEVFRVPGANEIPHVASHVVRSRLYDAVLVLGVIVEGETIHADVIARTTAGALQTLAISEPTPIINGILAVRNEEQAAARTSGSMARGPELAAATMQMGNLSNEIMKTMDPDLDQLLEDLSDEEDSFFDFDEDEDR